MSIEQPNITDFLTGLLSPIIEKIVKENIITIPKQKAEETAIEKFLDTKEVSEIFGVSSVSVWDWEKKGILKSYRIGNLKRFKLSEVMESPKLIERKQKGSRQ